MTTGSTSTGSSGTRSTRPVAEAGPVGQPGRAARSAAPPPGQADRVPDPERDERTAFGAGASTWRDQPPEALRDEAVRVLRGDALAHVVDLVCWRDGDHLHVADHRGHARAPSAAPHRPVEVLDGRDPVEQQDPSVLATDVYPYAWERLAGLLAGEEVDRVPDLVVVHAGAHHWPERGGHLGEHGSLNAVQSRAPLLLAGAGVDARGVLGRGCRTVDVAATLAHAVGAPTDGMTGRPLDDLVDPSRVRHVVGLLWDGAPSGQVLDGAADGSLPALSRLLERGCGLSAGAVAEFPSVTLVNHTSALVGVGPGTHGVVHNAYYDRATGRTTVPNDASTWHRHREWLRPAARTVFERLAEADPHAVSVCVNDPCERGATASTFALVRAAREAAAERGEADDGSGSGSFVDALPDPSTDALAEHAAAAANPRYRWASKVDAGGLHQVLGAWADAPPRLTWWNQVLTDTGGHEGGPGSAIQLAALREADRRLGAFLDHLEARDLLDATTFLLTADHGMEAADPSVTGDWDEALREAGLPFRDEGYGFVYLGDDVVPSA